MGPSLTGGMRAPAVRSPRRTPKMPKATVPKARAPRAPKAKTSKPKAPGVANSPLYDPSAILSGQGLADAATALTDATYQPQIASLERQQGSTMAQGTRLMANAGDYYRQLAQQEAGGLAREAAIGQLLQQQQSGVGQAAQGAFQQMGTDEAARQAADQAVRGGGLQGAGPDQVAAAITGGQGRSAEIQQAAQNEGALQASNWESLANANLQARQVHGGEVQGQLATSLANANRGLQGKLTDLNANRANDVTKNVVNLRQQAFTDLATMQGLGLKQADLKASVTKANQANKTANRRISSSAHQQSANRQSRESVAAANRTSAEKHAAAAATAKQTAADQKHLADVRAKAGKAWATVEDTLPQMDAAVPITDAAGNDTGRTRPATTAETLGALRKNKVPEWAIQAALSIRHTSVNGQGGYITPDIIAMIHRDAPDVRIPGKYRPPQAGRLKNYPK